MRTSIWTLAMTLSRSHMVGKSGRSKGMESKVRNSIGLKTGLEKGVYKMGRKRYFPIRGPLTSRAPQEFVLNPFFFVIYINDSDDNEI